MQITGKTAGERGGADEGCGGEDGRRRDVAALFANGGADAAAPPIRARAREASARLFGVDPQDERPLAEGDAIGPYQVRRLLGAGGQGLVYEAWHRALGRKVAVKVPRRNVAARLVKEARSAARLEHDSIVRVDDIGQSGDRPYLTMELCPGGSLAERIRRHPNGLPVAAVQAVARRVLSALGYAHDKGFVHRDIKPQNILFDREGRAKLCDFGIGIWATTDPKLRASLTLSRGATSKVAGTPLYIAPEQEDPSLRGGRPLDGRADLFSFGKVLFEMLTGASPRTIRPPSTLRSGLDLRWDDIVFRLLQEDPDRRFPDAAAAWEAIAPLTSSGDPEVDRALQEGARAVANADRVLGNGKGPEPEGEKVPLFPNPQDFPGSDDPKIDRALAEVAMQHEIPLLEQAGFVRRRPRRPAGETYLGLLALASAIGLFLNLWVIPKFVSMFMEMELELPWISKILVGHAWALGIGFLVVGLLLYPFARRSHRRAGSTAILLFAVYVLFLVAGVFLPLIEITESIG